MSSEDTSEDSSEATVVGEIVLQVACGVAIITNLVSMAVFVRTAQLHVKYYAFVFNLVLSDFAFPAFMILIIYFHVSAVQTLPRIALFAAELNILAVAANRFLAITITPSARYDAMMTRGRLVVACLSIWVIAAILYVPTTLTDSEIVIHLVRPGISFLIILLTGVLYYVTFQKIARHWGPLASTHGVTGNEDQSGTRLRRTRHLMITFTFILVSTVVCWIPFTFINVAEYFDWYPGLDIGIAARFSTAFLVAHSVIDPFIYWWRIGEFREGFYQLMCCCRNRQSNLLNATESDIETVETAM